MPLVFVLSIGISFVSVSAAAEVFWLTLFLVRQVLLRLLRDHPPD